MATCECVSSWLIPAVATQKAPGDVRGRAAARTQHWGQTWSRLLRGPGGGQWGRPSAGCPSMGGPPEPGQRPTGLRQRGGSRPGLRRDSSRRPHPLQPHWKGRSRTGRSRSCSGTASVAAACHSGRLLGNRVLLGRREGAGSPQRTEVLCVLAAAGVSVVSDKNSGKFSLFLLRVRHTRDAS